jgi:hypothetical protein
MLVAEKLDWNGLKIKKSVGNKKIIMSYEVPVPDPFPRVVRTLANT